MQDRELAQQIEDLIEVADMELQLEPQNEDVDLRPSAPQVTVQSPSPPAAELTLSKEGDVVLLDDDPTMDLYNLSYDEFQKRIVQARRKHFPDDHASLAFTRERVIVAGTSKNPNAIAEANSAFAGATRSNSHYLMAKNKQLAQNLQGAQQEIEQLCASAQNVIYAQVYLEEMRATTLGEVSTLGETMRDLYEELITIHKAVVHLHGCSNRAVTLLKGMYKFPLSPCRNRQCDIKGHCLTCQRK